jgi:hypothetical protein
MNKVGPTSCGVFFASLYLSLSLSLYSQAMPELRPSTGRCPTKTPIYLAKAFQSFPST